jgi:hypothetical protein
MTKNIRKTIPESLEDIYGGNVRASTLFQDSSEIFLTPRFVREARPNEWIKKCGGNVFKYLKTLLAYLK